MPPSLQNGIVGGHPPTVTPWTSSTGGKVCATLMLRHPFPDIHPGPLRLSGPNMRSLKDFSSIQLHCGKVQYSFCFAMAFCATRYPNIAGTLEIRGGTQNERTEGGFLALHWFHFRTRKRRLR